jgi:UDP-N-acetyl-D-galactosamine dehydrogenase
MNIAVIGLGYVGLPLFCELQKSFNTFGFDTNQDRINELKNNLDTTNEINASELKAIDKNRFLSDPEAIGNIDLFIITVPTPIDKNNNPDLSSLSAATSFVAKKIKPNGIVVYESTVYPGCTEEFCGKIIEEISGFKLNETYSLGYSPERINPGDKDNTIRTITKIISASNPNALEKIKTVYSKVVDAGLFIAKNIKTAEAAKVIENTQRDINIALINELSMIFNKIGINTSDVLDAADTKWNFHKYLPGLVGGHCIGVDPYYLSYKSKQVGITPKIIDAGRETNDNMHNVIVSELIKQMIAKKVDFSKANILILGYTFKENCPDSRNSRISYLISEIESYDIKVDFYDPYIEKSTIEIEKLNNSKKEFDAVIIAVPHDQFKALSFSKLKSICKDNGLIFDLKGVYPDEPVNFRL